MSDTPEPDREGLPGWVGFVVGPALGAIFAYNSNRTVDWGEGVLLQIVLGGAVIGLLGGAIVFWMDRGR